MNSQQDIDQPELIQLIGELLPLNEIDAFPASRSFSTAQTNSAADRFQFFTVSELQIKSSDDMADEITRAFSSLLAAAYQNSWDIALRIRGSKQGAELAIGLAGAGSDYHEEDTQVFERLLRGVLPGLRYENADAGTEAYPADFNHGGQVTGLPRLIEKQDAKQRFRLANILRAMTGEPYELMFFAKPISEKDAAKNLQAIWALQDRCHRITRQTKSEQESSGSSGQASITPSSRKLLWRKIVGGETSTSNSKTSNRTQGVSTEEQNSAALALEALAESYAKRNVEGLRTGLWDVTVSFVATSKVGAKALGGVLIGEMARPDDDFQQPRLQLFDLQLGQKHLVPIKEQIQGVGEIQTTFLTTQELACIIRFPDEPVPGYSIATAPDFSLSLPGIVQGKGIGQVCDLANVNGGIFGISLHELAKHVFVTGITGSGKSHTVRQILKQFADLPFLVIELAKREYRGLLSDLTLTNRLNIYTPGDARIAPFSINPFYILPGSPVLEHIDCLKALFNASFGLYGPMPHILEQCLYRIYENKGWDLLMGWHPLLINQHHETLEERYADAAFAHVFPLLPDLIHEIEICIAQAGYSGELRDNIGAALVTRMKSLCVGGKGALFVSLAPLDMGDLLAKPTIFEMEGLADDDDKAFFTGLLLTYISSYRQQNSPARSPLQPLVNGARHVLVIEEAHRLLRNAGSARVGEMSGNPREKAIEFFANMLSELRSTGQGVIIAEQIPSKILPDVIKNTNTKIVHRLAARDDQLLMAATLGLEDIDARFLNSLATGEALAHKESMNMPVKLKIHAGTALSGRTDEKVRQHMKSTCHTSSLHLAKLMLNARRDLEFTSLRTLCSLLASQDLASVRSKALHGLRLGTGTPEQDESSAQVLAVTVCSLLSRGVFSAYSDESVHMLLGLTQELIRNGEEKHYPQWLQLIEKNWGEPLSAALGKRLSELVLRKLLVNGRPIIDRQAHLASNAVRSYFFSVDQALVQIIVNRVINRLGGFNG